MPRWRRVGIDNRLGSVAVSRRTPSVLHDRVSLGDGGWRDEQCHVSMGRGRARAMRVMERDFRLGSATAMPTTVRSLLNSFVRMEACMTHEAKRRKTHNEVWTASLQGSMARSVSCSALEKDDIARGDSSVERWRESVRRRGARERIRTSASEHASCVMAAVFEMLPAVLMSSARMCSAWSTGT